MAHQQHHDHHHKDHHVDSDQVEELMMGLNMRSSRSIKSRVLLQYNDFLALRGLNPQGPTSCGRGERFPSCVGPMKTRNNVPTCEHFRRDCH